MDQKADGDSIFFNQDEPFTVDNSANPFPDFVNLAKKRRRFSCLGCGTRLLVSFLLFSGFLAIELFWGKSDVEPGPETTLISEPLTASGMIDYRGYLNEKSAIGIKPETNAVVDYYQLNGLLEIDAERQSKIAGWLQVDPFTYQGPRIEEVPKELAAVYVEALEVKPWTAADSPELSDWIDRQEEALALAALASRKPHFFFPLVTANEDELFMSTPLDMVQFARDLAQRFQVRATRHIGENQPLEALEDIESIHRLARQVSQGPTMVSSAVALVIEAIALTTTQQLLASKQLNEQQLKELTLALWNRAALRSVVEQIDEDERFSMLDTMYHLATGRSSLDGSGVDAGGEYKEPVLSKAFRRMYDWNIVLKVVNEWMDRTWEAARTEGYVQREQALEDLHQQLESLEREGSEFRWGMLPRRGRSEQFAAALITMLMPAVKSAIEAELRTLLGQRMTATVAALHAYQQSTGAFSEDLQALVPDYLPQVPEDLFSPGELINYLRTEKGFELYSDGVDLGDSGVIKPFGREVDLRIQYPQPTGEK